MSMSLRRTAALVLAGLGLCSTAPQVAAQTRPSVNASAYYPSYGQQMARNYYRINTTTQRPLTARRSFYGGVGRSGWRSSGGYGGFPVYGYGFGINPYDGLYNPYGGVLSGAADVISSSGQYWNDIEKARITREQSRQEAMKTNRMRLQYEIEYERMQPTALTLKRKERTTKIEWARKYAPSTEIWAGTTLNVLLKSAIDSGRIEVGPKIALDYDTLKGINIKEKASVGNVGLLKNGPKLKWPMSLQDTPFDDGRTSFSKHLAECLQQLPSADGLQRKSYRALQADLKKLNSTLDANVSNMSTSDWINGRKYLNELKGVVRALPDQRVAVSFDRSWVTKIDSVGGLVEYMKSKGLEFAPAAAAGDNSCYSSLYYSLRSFEMAVNGASLRTR
jgi:hypothetical protein